MKQRIIHVLIYSGWWLLLVIGSAKVLADSTSLNLALPNMGGSYGSDRIRDGDAECQSAIDGSTRLEVGTVVALDNIYTPFDSENPDLPSSKDAGIYARIIIPLDAPPKRLDCTKLYQYTLRKRLVEIRKLEAEIEQLKKLQFEN